MKRLFLVLLLLPLPAFATTYYTAKDCSGGSTPPNCTDANDGMSRATAKLTITAGLALMSGSDTLIIGDGVYPEIIHNNVPSGAMGAPTLIKAEHPRQAIMRPTFDGVNYGVVLIGQNTNTFAYITFDGIVADAVNTSGVPWYFSSDTGDGQHDIIIQNCEGINSPPAAVDSVGISIQHGTNHMQILNSEFSGNGHYGIYVADHDSLIEGNSVHDNGGFGIHVYYLGAGVNNNVLRNNRIYNNSTGTDLGSVGAAVLLSTGSNTLFYNNLIYNNKAQPNTDGIVVYVESGGKVFNNTIYDSSGACIVIDSTSSSTTIQNNICYQNASAITDGGTSTTCDHNLNVTSCGTTEGSTDPLFVNTGGANFHLQDGSPAIGAGTDLSGTFTTDFDGVTRGASWDQGAFENVPAIPPGVAITNIFASPVIQ